MMQLVSICWSFCKLSDYLCQTFTLDVGKQLSVPMTLSSAHLSVIHSSQRYRIIIGFLSLTHVYKYITTVRRGIQLLTDGHMPKDYIAQQPYLYCLHLGRQKAEELAFDYSQCQRRSTYGSIWSNEPNINIYLQSLFKVSTIKSSLQDIQHFDWRSMLILFSYVLYV